MMSIKVNHIILCEWHILDRDGRHSFINVYGNVMVPHVPASLLSMFIAIELVGGIGDSFSIHIIDPRGKPLGEGIEQAINPPEEAPESRFVQVTTTSVIQIKSLLFIKEGVYRVVVKSGKRVIGTRRFGVFVRAVKD